MPRKSAPLTLSEEDEKRLMEIARGPDEEVAKRAQIILACKDTAQNKDVAEKLQVTPATVGHWKEAFREKGIDGLGYHKRGAREKSLPYNLDEEVKKAACGGEKWTITSLAKHLGAPVDQVEKSAERQRLTFKRSARWAIQTTDSMIANSVELVGAWLGQEQGILITCTNKYGIATRPGELVTVSSSLAKALSQGTVPLENAIIEASIHNDPVQCSYAGKPAAFIEDYFHSAPKAPSLCYQIIGYGPDIPRIPQGRLSDTTINWSAGLKDWLDSFRRWVGSEGSSTKLAWAERLCYVLMIYMTSEGQEKRSAIQWSKAIERIGTIEAPVRIADETLWLDGETISEQLARKFSEVDDEDDDGLTIEMVTAVKGKDIKSSTVTSRKILESVDQFSFDSLNEMLRSIDAIEAPITEAARENELKSIRLAIEELKKETARRTAEGQARTAEWKDRSGPALERTCRTPPWVPPQSQKLPHEDL